LRLRSNDSGVKPPPMVADSPNQAISLLFSIEKVCTNKGNRKNFELIDETSDRRY